jgi:N utilization substance protein A
MPAQIKSEFLLALNQLCSERNINIETVLETIKQSLIAAYRKDRALVNEPVELENFIAEIDQTTGEAAIFEKKEDGSKGKNVTPPGFGRIAAQTAGQVLRQRIREAEKKAVIDDFTTKIGGIVSGSILRFDGPNIIVDIAKAEGVMPPSEQVPQEHYRLNQKLTFYIEGIRDSARGQEIIVSRAHKNLVIELFRREVPELQNESIEVKAIAREAGGRTKIAVTALQPGIDPVGACVGQKGVRVQLVITELGGFEKLDIIQWSDDPANLITQALAPAKDIEVILDKKTQSAVAIVPDDKLSLAIGREGQNARLAAKITGWRIDIKPKSTYEKKEESQTDVTKNEKSEVTND